MIVMYIINTYYVNIAAISKKSFFLTTIKLPIYCKLLVLIKSFKS